MYCEWVGWCALKPEAQAAWVQAIGALMAIGATWWLAHTQIRRADRERQTEREFKRRVFAFNVLPHINAWYEAAQLAHAAFVEWRSLPIEERWIEPTFQIVEKAYSPASFEMHFNAADLLSLGKEGETLAKLLYRSKVDGKRFTDMRDTLRSGENFDNLTNIVESSLRQILIELRGPLEKVNAIVRSDEE